MAEVVYNIFEAYKAFLQTIPVVGHFFTLISEKPSAPGSPFHVAQPNFYRDICLWGAFFLFSSKLITILMRMMAAKTLDKVALNPKGAEKLKVIDTYIAALMHHVVTVAVAGFQIYKDWNRTAEERATVDYTPSHSLCIVISLGYLLEDLLFYVIPKRDVLYFVHHVCFMLLSFSMIDVFEDAPAYFLKYTPYSTICEMSAIPFITAWFLRLFDIKTGQSLCEQLFVVLFFFLRIINLPIALTSIVWSNDKPKPYVSICSYLGIILQVYWMYEIIASVMRRGKEKKEKKGEGEKEK